MKVLLANCFTGRKPDEGHKTVLFWGEQKDSKELNPTEEKDIRDFLSFLKNNGLSNLSINDASHGKVIKFSICYLQKVERLLKDFFGDDKVSDFAFPVHIW